MTWIIIGSILAVLLLAGIILLGMSMARAGRDSRPDDRPPTPFDD